MAELESILEQKLIDKLCFEKSQWTYRPDIKTEDDLWANFKHILEQNNKAKLKDVPLSDSEFAKIKNDVSHASFFEAGKWLCGESGKVYVHVQRGNETLHLVVMNNEHIAGGTSVYEVINQYQAFKDESELQSRNRRFDVTLLINGLPMIHIELKNKSHSYVEGFRQIEKYIAEDKFRGIFSNVQMFVVSNGVDTRYFAANRKPGKKFMTSWVDRENNNVCDYLDFADAVLRIPKAHEMVAKYTVLDEKEKCLKILRPYQIHAIEAIREASKVGKSGFVWHTTGSGKTITSYKVSRNLLMDIPSIDKTVFLIDRKDLDNQTNESFAAYAVNDIVDVDKTDYVGDLMKKLTDNNRNMIITTRQKLQIIISKRLKEGTREYEKIKNLRVAFVVDECHRAVTPQTKREIEKVFSNSLWYGFTGTPIFEENKYEQMGDLAQTTEELYGPCIHNYTIKEAIHDKNVLGFNVENLGPKGIKEEDEDSYYHSEKHMRSVVDVILNQSYAKFGMQNGKGNAYEAMLTVESIEMAKKYYDLIMRVKAGEDELKISEDIKKALPDFPKVAITFSVSENEESSISNQDDMKRYLTYYNTMFGTHYKMDGIATYNENLNDRLARKGDKYKHDRHEQLDLVIVVDRLLTGFDAPCLSTLYIDRPPMNPQGLIQAFSRTNRLLDENKKYGQIVTFRSPKEYKDKINDALLLYSKGGTGNVIAEDWYEVLESFSVSLKALKILTPTPSDAGYLSDKEKKQFIKLFRAVDHDFAHLKSFTTYEPKVVLDMGFSQEEYDDYAAFYKNIMAELREEKSDEDEEETVMDDYELVAFNKFHIDFEYIMDLWQQMVENPYSDDFDDGFAAITEYANSIIEENPRLSEIMLKELDNFEKNKEKYHKENINIYVLIEKERNAVINKAIEKFADRWCMKVEDVRYEIGQYKRGEIKNESQFKEMPDYTACMEKMKQEGEKVSKFALRKNLVNEFKNVLMPEIEPLLK